MKNLLINLLFLLLLLPVSVRAQQSANADSLLDRMTGNWVLSGVIDGKQTTHDISTSWVLGHQYIQIREVSREKNPDGTPAYEATVFISHTQSSKEYTCLWLDNTGNGGLSANAFGHATQNDELIEFLFKTSPGSIFHTKFVYEITTGNWRWYMDDEENGKFTSFARVKLIRKQK